MEVSHTQSTAKSTITLQRSPLVNLLNIPVPKTSQCGTMKTGKARVLTSAECLKALLEKENEKKKKAEEKEQRKQERLVKKNLGNLLMIQICLKALIYNSKK